MVTLKFLAWNNKYGHTTFYQISKEKKGVFWQGALIHLAYFK